MAPVERIHRLLRLVELLGSGRGYNSTQLADLCEVSRRTIFRDLKTLQASGVSVHFDDQRQGYSIPATVYLPPADLNLSESISLLVLCHELGDAQRGIPFHDAARSAALKLLSNLPHRLRQYVGELTDSISMRLDARNILDLSDQSKAHYELLLQALSKRRQVRVRYNALVEGKVIGTAISPYRVLFQRHSWYVIGRSSLHRSIRTFNVSRILQAEMLETPYQIPPRFNLDRYFGNAWSMIRGQPAQVVVRFQKMVAQNVAEVQWHKTQQTVWNADGTLDFHVMVDGLREIIWWILGYGDQAEVLRPRELRNQIKDRVEAMRKTYARKPSPLRKRRKK